MKKNRYVTLVSGMLIQFCAGIIYMWSVFKDPVAQSLGWDPSAAGFTSSIMLAAFVLGIIIGGRVQDSMGPKIVTLAGSIIMSLGILLSSFVTSSAPQLIYLTYGITGGFGVGVIYTCTVSTVQKSFPDKRGFATGLIVSSFGLSLVVFAPVAEFMLERVGVPATFRVFGIGFLVICTICSLFISAPESANKGSANAAVSNIKQYSTLEMLKTKQFYLIALSMFFILPAYFILNPMIKSLGIERGLSNESAVAGVMITGICSAAGRLILSWISDKTGRKNAILAAGAITLISGLVMTFATGALFLVCVGAIAFAFGGSSGVYAAITAENFGTKNAGLNFGCVMTAFGLSALISPAVSKALSANGDYVLSFTVAAVTSAIAIVLVLFIKSPKKEQGA